MRERIEKLEQLIAERNSVEMPQQELATPSGAATDYSMSPPAAAAPMAVPFKKKTKNCKCVGLAGGWAG